jgi:hypothetical protein
LRRPRRREQNETLTVLFRWKQHERTPDASKKTGDLSKLDAGKKSRSVSTPTRSNTNVGEINWCPEQVKRVPDDEGDAHYNDLKCGSLLLSDDV